MGKTKLLEGLGIKEENDIINDYSSRRTADVTQKSSIHSRPASANTRTRAPIESSYNKREPYNLNPTNNYNSRPNVNHNHNIIVDKPKINLGANPSNQNNNYSSNNNPSSIKK